MRRFAKSPPSDTGRKAGEKMVILYSTGCPKCRVLKQKLDSKSIQYTEENSVDVMLSLGIMQVPVLSVDDKLLSFAEANEWVNTQ